MNALGFGSHAFGLLWGTNNHRSAYVILTHSDPSSGRNPFVQEEVIRVSVEPRNRLSTENPIPSQNADLHGNALSRAGISP